MAPPPSPPAHDLNRALLADLQCQQAYPSITLLMNTCPGAPLSHTEIATARHLAEDAGRRLDGDVSAELRASLELKLSDLIDQQSTERSAYALALQGSGRDRRRRRPRNARPHRRRHPLLDD